MYLDFHAHFNSDDPELLRKFVAVCETNQCRAAMIGGVHYGESDFPPNDVVIERCKKYPEWLVPIAKVDLWDTAPDLGALRRWVDNGARGVKCIYPYYPYDHDLYMPLYAECQKLGLPILFHTGNYRPNVEDPISQRPTLLNMDPLRIDRIARSFQRLSIVIAHLGTTFWRVQAAELIKLHPNVYSDLAGCGSWQALSAEELAALLHRDLQICRDSTGFFRKLVFGSDCYVTHPEIQTAAKLHYEQILNKIGATEELRDQVMGGTVSAWLK